MNDTQQVRKGTDVCHLNRENISLSHFRQFLQQNIESFKCTMNEPSNIFLLNLSYFNASHELSLIQ